MLRPLGDRVIIEVAKEEEKTVGGIVLSISSKRETPNWVPLLQSAKAARSKTVKKLLPLSTQATK